MRVVVETLVGLVLLCGMLAAIDCLPAKIKRATTTPSVSATRQCRGKVAPMIICDRVTRTITPQKECVICPGTAINCETLTGVWCTMTCDDSECVER